MVSDVNMPDTIRMPEIGDVIAGKYRVEKLLGRGGMGSVYTARHNSTHRLFALKLLSSSLAGDVEAKERFIREAKLAGSIDHPAIVEIYDIGYHDNGSLYMVMDLLKGESLADRLKRGPISVAEAIHVMRGIIQGIRAAHDLDIVHRDLKPDNIFLCKFPGSDSVEPRILDFGISKALSSDRHSMAALTKTGEMLGTPLYMSPEQIDGTKNIDQRTDIYALGVILYQMVSGDVPYQATNFAGLVYEIMSGQAKPLSNVVLNLPEGLSDLIMKAMAVSRDSRFKDIGDFEQALNSFDCDSKESRGSNYHHTEHLFHKPGVVPETLTPFKTEVSKADTTVVRSPVAVGVMFVSILVGISSAGYFILYRDNHPTSDKAADLTESAVHSEEAIPRSETSARIDTYNIISKDAGLEDKKKEKPSQIRKESPVSKKESIVRAQSKRHSEVKVTTRSKSKVPTKNTGEAVTLPDSKEKTQLEDNQIQNGYKIDDQSIIDPF